MAQQPCARHFFGNCPIRVDSRFCRAHPHTDKSRRCHSNSTLEERTELGRLFERRSPRSGSNTSQGRQLRACWPPARSEHLGGKPTPSPTAYSLDAIGRQQGSRGRPANRASRRAASDTEFRREQPGCLLLALSGHCTTEFGCLLLGVKRTFSRPVRMSASDPKATLTL